MNYELQSTASNTPKIILFGGTFDPIHIGHLVLAEYALEYIKAENVIFIPCYKPPHKVGYKLSHWKYRFDMIKLAIKDNKKFKVDTFEIKRGGVSYTYITVDWFSQQYTNVELYFLIGFDSLLTLPTWQNWQSIVNKVKFLVGQRMVNKGQFQQLPKSLVKKVIFFDSPLIEISSTEIRYRVYHGQSIKYMVLPSVEKYIFKHRLYISRINK